MGYIALYLFVWLISLAYNKAKNRHVGLAKTQKSLGKFGSPHEEAANWVQREWFGIA